MSAPTLKVIALISGGKDSFFSILHCLASGHEVVALANLHPPLLAGDEQSEDIDSFMYQTVGHGVIPLYAEALGIPLFRQAITGGAVNHAREYAPPVGAGIDETEDLVPLLRRIKGEIPGANAVSTGAILSTYQRTRVESVAIRLGLIPLSYLWQYLYLPPYQQTSLLDDMRAVGQDARIIKVASGGLNESFLWLDVTDKTVITRMRRRMEMYGGGEGGALIGEGGEFETLVLNGPEALWKKKIQIESIEKISAEGGSSFARLAGAKLVEKGVAPGDSTCSPRIPPLLDVEFEQVLSIVTGLSEQVAKPSVSLQSQVKLNHWTNLGDEPQEVWEALSKGDYLQLANIRSPPYGSTTDQMTDIVHQTLFRLHRLGLETADIAHSTILLGDMAAFATINPIYGSLFTKPNPPSRVTISCGELMPPGVHVVLSIVVIRSKEPGKRQGLHVQSRSYWAPANIGPYSQAISVPLERQITEDDMSGTCEPRIVYVAGQIPLVPASMEMVKAEQLPLNNGNDHISNISKDFLAQSVLSLQHLWRIGRAMEMVAWTGAVAFISHCSEDESASRADIASETWFNIHNHLRLNREKAVAVSEEEEEDAQEFDIWDLQNRVTQLPISTGEERDARLLLPDYSKIAFDSAGDKSAPPVFVAEVAELPRGADIEWCSTGIATAPKVKYSTRSFERYREQTCSLEISEHSRTEIVYIGFKSVEALSSFMERESSGAGKTLTVYMTKILPQLFCERYKPMLVPCFQIWEKQAHELEHFEVLIVMRKDIRLECL